MEANDVKAMREALEEVAQSAAEIMERVRHKDGLAFNTANYIVGIAKAALSAPPRNCDVGTAEEQSERFSDFCLSHQKTLSVEDNGEVHTRCDKCPIQEIHANVEHDEAIICGIDWAQMPYNESEAKK